MTCKSLKTLANHFLKVIGINVRLDLATSPSFRKAFSFSLMMWATAASDRGGGGATGTVVAGAVSPVIGGEAESSFLFLSFSGLTEVEGCSTL